MSRTLAANVTKSDDLLTLSGAIDAQAGDLFRIGDEVVEFALYYAPYRHPSQLDRSRVYVRRGVSGTTAASHSAGAAFVAAADGLVASSDETKPDPFASGGSGSLTVTDGTTSVAATTLQMPAGTISDLGSGVAGVGLVLQQIGPFRIDFDTPGETADQTFGTGDNVTFGPELPVGSVVLHAWPVVVSGFNPGESPTGIVEVDIGVGWDNDSLSNGKLVEKGWAINDLAFGVAGHFDHVLSQFSDALSVGRVIVRTTGCRLFCTNRVVSGAPNPQTQGSMDIYAIIATPAA